MQRDESLLLDIAEAAKLILGFTEGLDYETFQADLKTRSAVIHQLLIIGEAAKLLSDGFRSLHPVIQWRDIARMRDKLIHHYAGINPKEVWKAVELDVPGLLAFIEPLLPRGEG